MAVNASRFTVGTSASLLQTADGSGDSLAGASRIIRNRGAVAVFLGNSTVIATTGYQLDPGESVSFNFQGGESLYGITASSTAVVHVLESGI